VFRAGTEARPNSASTSQPGLQLIQRIRDEANRLALGFHRQAEERRVLRVELRRPEGIGPCAAAALLNQFGSVEEISRGAARRAKAPCQGCPRRRRAISLRELPKTGRCG